jgi:YesN/AraC family two-component response regulator
MEMATTTGPAKMGFKMLAALFLFLLIAAGAFVVLKRRGQGREIISGTDDPELKRIIEYIESHISEEITTDKLRKDLHLAVHQFYKILKNGKAGSLPQLLNNLRVRRAGEMLIRTQKSISEIGYEVGFTEARYFTKVFKDYTGLNPSEFRSQNKFQP